MRSHGFDKMEKAKWLLIEAMSSATTKDELKRLDTIIVKLEVLQNTAKEVKE